MNFGKIYGCDPGNGPGMRAVLFVSGCSHHCEGCFNPETWAPTYGQPFTGDALEAVIDAVNKPYIQGLTILGGEPMEPYNQADVLGVVQAVRERCPGKDIWIYSGYTFDELVGVQSSRAATTLARDILNRVDVLVDGEFVQKDKDVTLAFRGSRNQRILDLPKSLRHDVAVWRSEYL